MSWSTRRMLEDWWRSTPICVKKHAHTHTPPHADKSLSHNPTTAYLFQHYDQQEQFFVPPVDLQSGMIPAGIVCGPRTPSSGGALSAHDRILSFIVYTGSLSLSASHRGCRKGCKERGAGRKFYQKHDFSLPAAGRSDSNDSCLAVSQTWCYYSNDCNTLLIS